MTTTHPAKSIIAFVFFGLISGFVMCKSGVLDKKSTTGNPSVNPPQDTTLPRHFGGSKSGIIVKPSEINPTDTSDEYMFSSKSGRIVKPIKTTPDTSKGQTIDTTKKGTSNEFVVPKN